MAQVSRLAGSTGHVLQVQIDDATSTSGGGKTGLTNSAVACYYKRNKDPGSAEVTLDAITLLGTYQTYAPGHGGFKEVDAANMPGLYEFQPPNAAMAAGSGSVVFYFTAAGAVPSKIFVELTGTDNQNGATGGLSTLQTVAQAVATGTVTPFVVSAATAPTATSFGVTQPGGAALTQPAAVFANPADPYEVIFTTGVNAGLHAVVITSSAGAGEVLFGTAAFPAPPAAGDAGLIL